MPAELQEYGGEEKLHQHLRGEHQAQLGREHLESAAQGEGTQRGP